MSFCPPPFTPTKYESVFPSFGETNCGLPCKYNGVYWKLEQDEMSIINLFWWIYIIIFLILCIIIWINMCMNIKYSSENCIYRPYLFQAPFCLVIGYSMYLLCFLIPLIVGKNDIVCSDDLNGIKTMSIINPGSSIPCTVIGTLWYVSKMLMGLYTATFSMSLWKQFYAPLNSIYTQLKQKTYCKCCCYCVSLIHCKCLFISDHINIGNRITPQSTWLQIICSRKLYIHYIIYTIAIIYTIFGYMNHAIKSIDPLGVCAIGTSDRDTFLVYLIIPQMICLIISSLFLPAAIVLFGDLQRKSSNLNDQNPRKRALSCKLLIYFICVEIAWDIATAGSLFFFFLRDKFEDGVQNRLQCLIMNNGNIIDECYTGYTYWFGWWIIIGGILPIVSFASLVLSCNSHNWKRWKSVLMMIEQPKTRSSLLSTSNDYGTTAQNNIELSISRKKYTYDNQTQKIKPTK